MLCDIFVGVLLDSNASSKLTLLKGFGLDKEDQGRRGLDNYWGAWEWFYKRAI